LGDAHFVGATEGSKVLGDRTIGSMSTAPPVAVAAVATDGGGADGVGKG
jgi:hypothetical protein